jgi:hypothetical protein
LQQRGVVQGVGEIGLVGVSHGEYCRSSVLPRP